jgi:very-short-patch-repair endonuclease/uncharacterized Zn-finger protein
MGKIKRKVVKCDLNGNVISEFKTLVDAGNEIGVTKNVIFRCCKNKKKILNEHTYHYIDIVEDLISDVIKPVKCPYCDRTFDNYNGLCKHVIRFKMHGEISQEKLLLDYKYEGKKPLCACGCGKETEMSYSMGGGIHFNELIKGHYSRIHNNWGHNQKAIDNSAKTRRSRFKSGDITQWNKGRGWSDTYTQNKINELYKKYENKKYARSSKSELDFAVRYLDAFGIKYESQKYIKEIRQFSDFYDIKTNTYIEYNGDFWHVNPAIYPDGAKYERQMNKIEKDKIKYEWIKKNGSNLIIIWENDVKNNKELVLKLLEPLLN